MKFSVTIHKENAPDETRSIEAPTRFDVYKLVEKEGGVVTSLKELTGKSILATPAWLEHLLEGRVKHAHIARFAKDLATMLSAGLSLSRALEVIERESESKRLQTISKGLSAVVATGSPFHKALEEYPKVFPGILVAMVRVGEESGSLSDSLNVVGVQMEHSDELTRKVKGALIYPAIIVVAIIIVSILMMIYVVPTLTKTFTDLKVELPFATRMFVLVSDFLVANVLLVVITGILIGVGGMAGARSKRGSAFITAVGLKLPAIGDLLRETYAARTARTISSLLTAGVPVLEALAITKEVVQVKAFATVIAEAEERVKKGESLSIAFAAHPKIYPILMGEMLIVGEETGKVAMLLKQAAEFYEGDVSEKTKNLSTIIEPILMLLIGAVVGIFAVSMIAPIYSISSAI